MEINYERYTFRVKHPDGRVTVRMNFVNGILMNMEIKCRKFRIVMDGENFENFDAAVNAALCSIAAMLREYEVTDVEHIEIPSEVLIMMGLLKK